MAREPNTAGSASTKQLGEALAALSADDALRLRQAAKLRSRGLADVTWEDLLHEAIARALDGRRKWPTSIPLIAFLIQTMRSIANEEWRRAARVPQIRAIPDLNDPEGPSQATDGIDQIDPERVAAAEQALKDIQDLFAGDAAALAVLAGLAEGSTPEEIQQAAALSAVEYASAQRRIRRNVARVDFK